MGDRSRDKMKTLHFKTEVNKLLFVFLFMIGASAAQLCHTSAKKVSLTGSSQQEVGHLEFRVTL